VCEIKRELFLQDIKERGGRTLILAKKWS
jgi:hypothetical protein